jgi:hypothetical protein
MFKWFESDLYFDTVSKFSETIEKPEYFVGFTDDVGDALTFKILKNDLITHRNAVQSAAGTNHRNKQVAFKLDVHNIINRLDVKLSPITRNNHIKQKKDLLMTY